ncbi:hypothetical protein Amme3_00054 [Pseudomonas phage vB_PpuM-Amme-3]|uniref:Uncharacterized protein n=1 Tax=Pseudomonas phage vB_PpuM-Amme-3 TaxID=3132617 RepID=A0AAX4MXZ7_9CAUD
MRHFMVKNDYQSKQRPRIMHGYKAGQVLEGLLTVAGSEVSLYGPTKADLVFGETPTNYCLSESYSQGLCIHDVVEVLPITDWRDLKTGSSYVADADIESNIGNVIKAGEVFLCDDSCHDDNQGVYERYGQYPQFSANGTNQYYFEKGNKGVKLFEVQTVDNKPEVVDTTEIKDTLVEGDTKAPQKRTKPIYEVQYNGQAVLLTKNRDKARRLKADLGGKEKGAIIMQYNAVKEIR